MSNRTLTNALFGLGLGVILAGCSKTEPGAPVPFTDASVELSAGRIHPKVCEGSANGKRFSVVGFAHWTSGTVAHIDSSGAGVAHIEIFERNGSDGKAMGKAYVPANVKIRTLFGGAIDEPQLEGTTTESKGIGRNRTNETTGTITDESMKLHLADGSVVNNTARIRVTLQVEGNNGMCNLNFVEARPAT